MKIPPSNPENAELLELYPGQIFRLKPDYDGIGARWQQWQQVCGFGRWGMPMTMYGSDNVLDRLAVVIRALTPVAGLAESVTEGSEQCLIATRNILAAQAAIKGVKQHV